MRPIRLEMQAFGSFAKHTALDFERLHGVWLICGDTGAGKTTIFDAIVYALYGRTSNDAARSGKSLRSDWAGAQDETYVSFTFAVHGKTWHIRRTPRYFRPKKNRTDELTEQVATVVLSGGDGAPLTKAGEVDQRVKELLGVDYGQFCQLALIAQGDFMKILRASTAERSALLRTLFRTGMYERFQRLLAEQARLGERELDMMRAQLRQSADMFRWDDESSGTAPFRALQSAKNALPGAELADVMTGQLAREKAQAEAAAALLPPLRAEVDRCNVRLGAAEALHARHEERARLAEEAAQDQAQLMEKEALARRHALASEAIAIRPAIVAAAEAQSRARLLTAALSAARQKTASCADALSHAAQQAEERTALVAQREQALAKSSRLKELLPRYDEARAQAQAVEAVTAQANALASTVRRMEADIAAQQNALVPLEQQYAALPALVEQRQSALARMQTASERLRIAQDMLTLRSEAAVANQAAERYRQVCADALAQVQQAEQAHGALVNRYIAQQAHYLAAQLEPGQPCPVCGSTAHPAPCRTADGKLVDQMMIDHAREAADRARRDYESRRAALEQALGKADAARMKLESAAQAAAFTASVDDVAREAKEIIRASDGEAQALGQRAEAASKAGREASAVRARLDQQRRELTQAQQRLAQKQAEQAESAGKLQTLRLLLPQEDEAAVRASLLALEREAHTLAARITALDEALASAQRAHAAAEAAEHAAEQQLKEANQTASDRQAALDEALRTSSFDDLAACEAHMPPSAEALQQERLALAAWHERRKSRLLRLEALEQELADKPDQPLEGLRTAIMEAQTALDAKQREAEALRRRYEDNAAVRNAYGALLRSMEERLHAAQRYAELSDLANGRDKETHLPFEMYVQRYWFSQVIEYANRRFSGMTDGMFALRLDDPTGGQGVKGLDLNVMDYQTGRERPASTLSGGESFKASLSLALGLADMIAEHTSSVHLEAMFIDEGFGTLDDASLHQALDVLSSLSEQDARMIGVISHRPEMRERIRCQVMVKKGANGSQLTMIAD